MTRPLEAQTTNESATEPRQARDYQVEAFDALWAALHQKKDPVCLSLATGGGKTFVAVNLVAEWVAKYGR